MTSMQTQITRVCNAERSFHIRYLNVRELDHLIPKPFAVDTSLFEMAESIRRFGMMNPIRVYYEKRDSKYYVISGERRLAALTLLGRTRILCHITTDPDTRDAVIIAELCLNGENNIFKSAAALSYLMNERKCDSYSLSRLSGISHAKIISLLALNDFTYEEKRKMFTSSFPESACFEIARITDPIIRRTVIDHLCSIRCNVADALEATRKKPRTSLGTKIVDNSIKKLTSLISKSGLAVTSSVTSTRDDRTYTINVKKPRADNENETV